MTSFTSVRERRLWRWTAAVVLAIYASIPFARTLSDELPNREVLDDTFFVAFLMLVIAVVLRALRLGRRGAEIFVVLFAALVFVMMFLRMASPLERSHVLEYGVVALLVHEALIERSRNGSPARHPALTAVVAASAIGAVDEIIQLLVPRRVFDPVDMVFNTLAATVAVGSTVALARLRHERLGGRATDHGLR